MLEGQLAFRFHAAAGLRPSSRSLPHSSHHLRICHI